MESFIFTKPEDASKNMDRSIKSYEEYLKKLKEKDEKQKNENKDPTMDIVKYLEKKVKRVTSFIAIYIF